MTSLRAILGFLQAMLPAMAVTLPLAILGRVLWQKRLRRWGLRTTAWHEAGLLLFVLLLAGLASQAILPRLEWTEGGWRLVETGWGGINLIPLAIFRDSRQQTRQQGNLIYFCINFFGNMAVFVPFGFFPPLLWRGVRLRRVLGVAFASSLFIELCQLPQYRGTDIDDLWLNTLGALLGYGIYKLLERPWGGWFAQFKVRNRTR